jgi:hypothetical protein
MLCDVRYVAEQALTGVLARMAYRMDLMDLGHALERSWRDPTRTNDLR